MVKSEKRGVSYYTYEELCEMLAKGYIAFRDFDRLAKTAVVPFRE